MSLIVQLCFLAALLLTVDGQNVFNQTFPGDASALSRKLDEQKGVIDRQAADLIRLGNISSILLEKINEQKTIISEKQATIDRHVADLTQLKSNASSLLKKTNDDAETIAEQKKVIDRHVADIGEARNNASILIEIINSQKKTISEKEAVIPVDINRLKNKMNELAPEQTSVMLLGGWHGDITNSTTIYNSMEKSWNNCNLTLPSTLGYHGAAIINNEIYIFGGDDETTQEHLNSLYKLEAGNKWEKMADMNEKRVSISQSSVVFKSEIWVIGGWNGTNALKSVEKYNPKTNNWTKMPELYESRSRAAATIIGGKIYVAGGWSDGSEIRNSVEVYDPEKGKWELFTPSLPYAVHSHILIGNNSQLFAIGGDMLSQEPTNKVWKMDVLDPRRKWKEMPSLKQKRFYSGAAIIVDELMVFGGAINYTNRIDSVEIFDGVEWKKGANLPDKRGFFASISLTCAQERLFLKRYIQPHVADLTQLKSNALVMLLGGWHEDITNSTTIYNSMEKSWNNCNLTLPSTLGYHGAAIINNEIYIFGGDDKTIQESLKSLYKLGADNKWERMADMNEKRRSISQSSIVFNSEIWVIGGSNGKSYLKSVEKYNPKTNNWTEMPELNESRSAAAATVVDGKIYVSGGWNGFETMNSVEVYDPEKGKWEIFTPSLPYGVDSHIFIGNHSHLIAIGGDLSLLEPTNRVWKMDVLDPKREWKEMPSLQQKRRNPGAAIIADELMVFGGSTNHIDKIDSVEVFDGVEWKNRTPLLEIRGAFAYIPLTSAQERLFLERFCQNY